MITRSKPRIYTRSYDGGYPISRRRARIRLGSSRSISRSSSESRLLVGLIPDERVYGGIGLDGEAIGRIVARRPAPVGAALSVASGAATVASGLIP